MRTLLEIHYDDVLTTIWQTKAAKEKKGRPAKSNGDYVVFQSVLQARKSKRNQQVALPSEVKEILRAHIDEDKCEKLEALRDVIAREMQSHGEADLDAMGMRFSHERPYQR